MSCMLRISGKALDPVSLVAGGRLKPDVVWNAGSPRLVGDRVHVNSGVAFVVSGADFGEFDRQVEESALFLRENQDEIVRMLSNAQVEGVELDFGVSLHEEVMLKTCSLPSAFLRLVSEFGIDVALSYYKFAGGPEDES